jgi:TonB family protein
MRTVKFAVLVGMCCVAPLAAQQHKPAGTLNEVVSKVIARENQEMNEIRQHAPIVETYIQKNKFAENDGSWQLDGDHYFIGRAELSKGLDLESLAARNDNTVRHIVARLNWLFDFGTEFLPKGFLQMIYLDANGLDTQNYNFDYVRREFLGKVRTLVFDVTPSRKGEKDRFVGRIWVEDESYTIVHFSGSYSGHKDSDVKFHFDSWRVNTGPNLWLPAFIYSEENTRKYPLRKAVSFKAQTRLWGYNSGQFQQEQELSQVLIESAAPVIDNSSEDTDLSPQQEQREWDLQAQNNVIEKLQAMGLIAPKGEVDKVLETVVNNLEVTNNLNFDPEVRCRVLMTSTIESFTLGRTIVLSRGLIDVLPDEASLAAVLAKELGYVILYRRVDTRFAFYDRFLRFDEKKTFQHFDFARNLKVSAAANAKAAELLKNSLYKDQLGPAEAFIAELQARSRQIPNLISPRLGDSRILKLPVEAGTDTESAARHIVALPLGGRVKLDPWDDTLGLLKSKPVSTVADREKMPFEITPFVIYLTRVGSENSVTSQLTFARKSLIEPSSVSAATNFLEAPADNAPPSSRGSSATKDLTSVTTPPRPNPNQPEGAGPAGMTKLESLLPPKPAESPEVVKASVSVSASLYPSIRIPAGIKFKSQMSRQRVSLQIGQLSSRVDPVYPDGAETQRMEGTVELHAIIGQDGTIQSVEPRSGPALLVSAAANAVRQWRYTPSSVGGQPVEAEEDITVTFRLPKQTAQPNLRELPTF